MENNYYKLTSSLGKFRAIRVDEVGKEGIYAEFSNDDINHKFNANIFFNGEIIDWEINRWIFSSHIKGEYDNPSTDFKIEAIDPQGEHIELYNTLYNH